MELKLNLNPKILERLVDAIEQLAADYATVNADTLRTARAPASDDRGSFFYQSDKELYEAELKKSKPAEIEIV